MRAGKRAAIATTAMAVGVLVVGLWAAVAAAVSTGQYSPANQGCPETADANTTQGATPGCHNAQLLIRDGDGGTEAEAGTLQDPQGQNVHSGTLALSPTGNATPQGTADGGTGVGGSFDTNYQPVPAGQCGLEDIVLYGLEDLLYLLQQGPQPCTLDPAAWNVPNQAPSVGAPQVSTGGGAGDPTALAQGGLAYFGADDNLDSGEHDGVDGQYGSGGAANGPSDGGSLFVAWQPVAGAQALAGWPAVLLMTTGGGQTTSLAPIAADPVPLAGAGAGACADGICVGVYSARQTVYQGGGGGGAQRDVYDYQGKDFGPYDCNSGSPANEQACTTEPGSNGTTAACTGDPSQPCGMDAYRQQEASNVTAEPGVQVYEDPDPQGSPALPPQLYPLPAAYAGTCGVTAGGGALQAPSGTPDTNGAGQLSVAPTGC